MKKAKKIIAFLLAFTLTFSCMSGIISAEKVYATSAEQSVNVNLHMGETWTDTDETGNYEGQVSGNLDEKIAKVKVTGSSQKAQLSSSGATFEGEKIPLSDCEYTFTEISATLTAETEIAPVSETEAPAEEAEEPAVQTEEPAAQTEAPAAQAKEPAEEAEVPAEEETEAPAEEETGVPAEEEAEAPAEEAEAPAEEAEAPAEEAEAPAEEAEVPAEEEAEVPAEEETEAPAEEETEAPAEEETEAPAEEETEAPAEEETGVPAAQTKALAVPTEAPAAQTRTYTIQGSANGTTVYMQTVNTYASGSGRPHGPNLAEITVTKNSNNDTFSLCDTNGSNQAGGYLYFWKTGSEDKKLTFDRDKATSGVPANCYFELYKKSENAPENSPIKGYEKVTSLEQIVSGKQYLIASQAEDGNYYLLHPSTGSDKYTHVAKVVDAPITEIEITGVSEGKTSVVVGKTTYNITVANEIKKITLEVGESCSVPGVVQNGDGAGCVTTAVTAEFAPYVAANAVESGKKYLIASGDYVMLNQSVNVDNAKGLGLKEADFEAGSHGSDLWLVTAVGDGYTIQDVDGKYLNIMDDGTDTVLVGDTSQTLSITLKNNTEGEFVISNRVNRYLNNGNRKNQIVKGYYYDNQSWKLYLPSDGTRITGDKGGTTVLTIGNINYEITVLPKAEPATPPGSSSGSGSGSSSTTEPTPATPTTIITPPATPAAPTDSKTNKTPTAQQETTTPAEPEDEEAVDVLIVTEKGSEAEIPAEELEKAAEAGAGLTVELEDAKVTFDNTALKAIAEQAQGLVIELRIVPIETNVMEEEQQQALEDKDVQKAVSAQLFCNGQYIGDFKGGKVTIAIPFVPQEGRKVEDYKVYYVSEEGEMTLMPAIFVDNYFVFEANHFSDYVIVYEGAEVSEEAEIPAAEETPAEKEAGFPIMLIVIVIIIAAAVIGFVLYKKKKDEQE